MADYKEQADNAGTIKGRATREGDTWGREGGGAVWAGVRLNYMFTSRYLPNGKL